MGHLEVSGRMTRGDFKLIAFLLVATLLAIPMSLMAAGESSGEVLISGPSGQTTVSLEEDDMYVIEGRDGDVVFKVSDGHIYCEESSCPDKICVELYEVERGRPVVCVPNGVTAMLASSKSGSSGEGELDAVSR